MPKNSQYEKELNNWIGLEKQAIELIKIVSNLWFEKSVELVLFRNQLFDRSISEVLSLHNYATGIAGKEITVSISAALALEISKLEISPSRIDLGKLANEWLDETGKHPSYTAFVLNKLAKFTGNDKLKLKPKDVVLYGFGRIGRLAARELIAQAGKGEQLRLRAIVTRGNSDEEILKRASLLRMDSVHGAFAGTIIEDLENKRLIINGNEVHMISANNPAEIDYQAYGIKDALLIDNTGATRDRDGLGKHLKANGIDKVLLTAPGKGDIPNVVYGVNQDQFDIHSESIFSAASCTTNAIVPVLKVIKDTLGIVSGHIETIHAYTNDQNLLDNYHNKSRRGRAAALNMVITETGAGKAVTKVFPELNGKLTANAVRVPTPNVSLAILSLRINKKVTKAEINNLIKDAALKGDLVEQIQYSYSEEIVSSDLVGNSCSSIFDSPATLISEDGQGIVLYVWYDNEFGYTKQVIRFCKFIADVRRLTYY